MEGAKSGSDSGAHQPDCYLLIPVRRSLVSQPLRPDLQAYIKISAKIIPFHQGVPHVSRGPTNRI